MFRAYLECIGKSKHLTKAVLVEAETPPPTQRPLGNHLKVSFKMSYIKQVLGKSQCNGSEGQLRRRGQPRNSVQ